MILKCVINEFIIRVLTKGTEKMEDIIYPWNNAQITFHLSGTKQVGSISEQVPGLSGFIYYENSNSIQTC